MNDIYNILKSTENECEYELHRLNSWSYCYNHFQNSFKNDKIDLELSALHLGFYLASWGMYRGSSFLLQNNYKIHEKFIQLIQNNKTYSLTTFDEIIHTKKNIENIYKKAIPKISKRNPNPNQEASVTNTLITKILLGIYGCVPAYDKYLVKGLGEKKYLKHFSKKSFDELNDFYEKNKKEFERFNKSCKTEYPKMKLIDMYFWKMGYEK